MSINNNLDKIWKYIILETDYSILYSCDSKAYQKQKESTENAIMLVRASNNNNSISSSSSTISNITADNCKTNRGSSRRIWYSNEFKAFIIKFYEDKYNRLSVS